MTITEQEINITSALLEREVTLTVLKPEDGDIAEPLNLLLLNDGQELESLGLKNTLETLYNTNRLKPVLIVAIHAGDDRLDEYGIAGKPDFKGRGAKAAVYTQFIKEELLPQLQQLTGFNEFDITAFAGFSLGGLSAFDIVWNNPALFNKTGVFSGSFWWRGKDLAKGYTEADRLMHQVIRETKNKPAISAWLQTGTRDETSDRNKNGIIDAIDDTIDLIREMEANGFKRPEEIQYVEVVGGTHDTATWGKAMAKFLVWAFGR
ncbi:alpha/beta hydrolase-fold protein [Mucilaginibacter sp. cycad4]|uniref:alpha/beta hydrolase n=1 Tax=Mucilaginibacter sp. cycad4 TaxID=3342096 RepID=UPI002AABE0D0|nr:alpha/beta hydrolase-fold protein [Mucilaginibacter gossypii]WPU97684.1 alpha/beta hydrolase-fold protein [Mucilaginibacter gossypii]